MIQKISLWWSVDANKTSHRFIVSSLLPPFNPPRYEQTKTCLVTKAPLLHIPGHKPKGIRIQEFLETFVNTVSGKLPSPKLRLSVILNECIIINKYVADCFISPSFIWSYTNQSTQKININAMFVFLAIAVHSFFAISLLHFSMMTTNQQISEIIRVW